MPASPSAERCAACKDVPESYCHCKPEDRPAHARVTCDLGYHPFQPTCPYCGNAPKGHEGCLMKGAVCEGCMTAHGEDEPCPGQPAPAPTLAALDRLDAALAEANVGHMDSYDTPGSRLLALAVNMAPALSAAVRQLEAVMDIVRNSHGVDGWHLNGDTALWGEFPEIDESFAALAAVAAAGEATNV